MKIKISKERYNEIKIIASKCIEDFLNNNDGHTTLDKFLAKYKDFLNNKEEIMIFTTMVLLPNTKNFLEKYEEFKNINVLASLYNIEPSIITTKIGLIDIYEKSYEDKNLLNISNEDVLRINYRISKDNEEISNRIDEAVNMIKRPK